LRHLADQGCELLREGGNHTVFVHRGNRKSSAVPRHAEVNDILAHKICRDLGIAKPVG